MAMVATLLVALVISMPGAQEARYGLQGHVMFESMREMQSVRVRLEGLDGRRYATTIPNAGGRFQFTDMPKGNYYVVVMLAGLEIARERVVLPQFAGVWVLVKRPPESPRNDDEPAIGDRHIVDVRQLSIPEDAIREYQKAIDSVRNGNTDGAIKRLHKAIQLAPDFYEAVVALARLHIDREEFDTAIEILRPDPSGASTIPGSAFYLGYAQYRLKEYDAAKIALTESLESDPVIPATRLMLANVYIKQGDARKALANIDAYLEENPEDEGRADAQEKRLELIEFLEQQ